MTNGSFSTRLIYVGFVLLIIGLSLYVIVPFLIPVISGFMLGYIFYPIYRWLEKNTHMPNLSASITTILVILLILVPLILLARPVAYETQTSYIKVLELLSATKEYTIDCAEGSSFLCPLIAKANRYISQPQVHYHIDNTAKTFKDTILNKVSGFFLSLPSVILKLFIMVFVLYFAFRDGSLFYTKFKDLLPFSSKHSDYLMSRFSSVTYAVIYGQLIVAAVQAILSLIGFWLFGVPSPILWGIMTFFAAIIPLLGPPIIWAPAAIIMAAEGIISNNSSTVVRALLLTLWGIFIVGIIDNILKPRIIGRRSDVHPVVILIGVLGGLISIGIIGIIIGPLILSLLMALIDIYSDHTKNETSLP